jgi:hypothetical protein
MDSVRCAMHKLCRGTHPLIQLHAPFYYNVVAIICVIGGNIHVA